MSTPPPGHDATQSLLQGGTATITPLMGGGGLEHGNPQESLLTGGTSAPIVPLQGGRRLKRRSRGRRSKSRSKSRSRSRSKSRQSKKQDGGAYQNAKFYNEQIPPTTAPLEDKTKNFDDLVLQYRVAANGIWNRSQKTSNTSVPILPMQGQCKKLKSGQKMTMYDRLAVILSPKVTRITIFPPIAGDEKLLQSCIDYIRKKDDPRTVFVFSPGVFNPNDPANNKKILASLLFLKQDAGLKSSIFLLSQNTDEEAKIGCDLTGEETDSKAIVNLLGPTYIVFTSECEVESKSPEGVTSTNTIGGIIISGAIATEPDIPACKLASVTRGVRDFISNSGIKRDESYKTVAFPPNINSPENLNGSNPFKVFNIQGSHAKFPFRDTMKDNMLRFKILEAEPPHGAFVPVPESSLALQGIQKHLVNGIYEIREPHPDVVKNWIELKFTQSELAFLKDLKIDDPEMLSEIFDESDSWTLELAEFMGDVAKSCRTELKQMMDVDCGNVREFLDKVGTYMAFMKPVIPEKAFQDNEAAQDELELVDMERRSLEEKVATLSADIAKTKKGQEELAFNLAKTPFEAKYFKDPYPVIQNLWGESLKGEEALARAETKVGVPYVKEGENGVPDGKFLNCEMIRVFNMKTKDQYVCELCAITPKETSGANNDATLVKLFKDIAAQFPAWYFSYK